ncbi:MAG: hypothetical protein A2751_03715 [Candidatus Doudnabacteria bacterium RIFCSPHIGHO2_01_FULL_46_14]|uniref:Nucleotidyl transferase domain-containing protein n=1 Tax=Candidatus Doudnabacteria bacterium RIFCSPHIGHO2_01_FULL_46_14 TaxID=1817824 RepID=A0A1F5NKK7_9BACT|nr:MAG: hypothetical protein A2751_03715 [Candidatus Doudnabacteria bacterium RIFCSPHIGHO2_01_FULL_46_14]
MQAVILAAGFGTRMGELTKTTPKPLLKIGNKTILEHNLEQLPEEIEEVILVTGYLGGQIKKAIGNNFAGKKITYVDQKELKGTAHALYQSKDLIRGRFLVLMGDDLYHKRDLEKLIKYPLAILVWQLQNGESGEDRHAIVKVDEAGELSDIVERQPAREGSLVNTAAYILNQNYFNYPLVGAGIPAKEFGLPQTFLQMVRDGAKFAVVPAEKWHKVASPEDLKL